jgi:hypothetical protein
MAVVSVRDWPKRKLQMAGCGILYEAYLKCKEFHKNKEHKDIIVYSRESAEKHR